MLPDANETTFLVRSTRRASSSVANTTRSPRPSETISPKTPEVENYETFVGTNAVPDLSSLLQGTIFRNAPNLADIRVNSSPKDKRGHANRPILVRRLRPQLQAVAGALRSEAARPADAAGTAGSQHHLRQDLRARSRGAPRDRLSRRLGMLQKERGVVDVDSSDKPLPLAMRARSRSAQSRALRHRCVRRSHRRSDMALHGATDFDAALAADAQTDRDSRPLRRAVPPRRGRARVNHDPVPSGRDSCRFRRSRRSSPKATRSRCIATTIEDATYVGADMAGRSSTYAVIERCSCNSRNDPLAAAAIASIGTASGI